MLHAEEACVLIDRFGMYYVLYTEGACALKLIDLVGTALSHHSGDHTQ